MPKVIHERDVCIGCGACAVVCEKYWEMAEDGKSNLKGAEKAGEGERGVEFHLEIPEDDLECNKEAAEMCPVNCIHVEKDGERVV